MSIFRRPILANIAIFCLLLLLFACAGQTQMHYKDLSYPKLGDIHIPEVKEVTLSNGMKLFLLEDHELPLINLTARIHVGSIYEPSDKIGLASITGEVMRTGGTTSRTGDEIDELLESIAASVETSIGRTSGSASMSVLKDDVETGLEVLADVLMHPVFDQDKIDLAKVQRRSAIARRNDNVNAIAGREFNKLIYGAESVYARHTEYATIDNIIRDDLVAFHGKYFHPNNMIVGMWGDFETDEMIQKVEAAFKAWESQEIDFPAVPQVKYAFRPTVNLIRKDDVNQTNIFVGHIGGKRDHPDYFAMVLMNRILGQGFTSRLFRNVRSRQGLAYSVFGVYDANYSYPGLFYVGCQTKSETTVKAIRAMLEEVRKITEREVTDEELAIAKDSYLNSFVFNFDSKGEIVNRLLTYEYYGYPHDFLQKTREGIEEVTKADILQAARRNVHPEALQILAVGRPEDFDEPLSVLGPVNEIDIAIPVPKEETPEATTESVAKGKALLAKTIEALGGKENLEALQSRKQSVDLSLNMGGQSLAASASEITVYPDKHRQEMQMPFGEVVQVLNGDQGWAQGPQGIVELNASQLREMQQGLARDTYLMLRNADEEGYTVQALGQETSDGKAYEVLMISKDDLAVKFYLDAETHLVAKRSYQGTAMGRPARLEEVYADYREVAGLKFPHTVTVLADGQKFAEGTITRLEVNPEVDSSVFARP